MNEPLTLTVLICVHTQSDMYDDLLIKALRSLEIQTYKNFKTLIILDDCWFKTEKRIVNSLFDLNIEIIKKDKKNGLFSAKNLGLKNIQTDLVAFLDGDDLYVNNKLEKQMMYMMKHNVDFLGTQSYNIYGLDEITIYDSCFRLGEYETNEQIYEIIDHENILTHGSMMIKMNRLKELNFYKDVRGSEDWDLWKRAKQMGHKFYQIQERLYILRVGTSVPR